MESTFWGLLAYIIMVVLIIVFGPKIFDTFHSPTMWGRLDGALDARARRDEIMSEVHEFQANEPEPETWAHKRYVKAYREAWDTENKRHQDYLKRSDKGITPIVPREDTNGVVEQEEG